MSTALEKNADQLKQVGEAIKNMQHYFTRARINTIHDLRNAGYNQNQIASMLGMPAGNIARDLKKWPTKQAIDPQLTKELLPIFKSILNKGE